MDSSHPTLPRQWFNPMVAASNRLVRLGSLRGFLLLILLSLAAAPCLPSDEINNRILYINSDHRGYPWSDEIEQGLRERLDGSGKKIELSVEYLDSRRFADGEQNESLARLMEIKYSLYRPALVVVSDNDAFDFVIRYRERLFPGLPVVFCGYNNFRPEYLEGIDNITGVNEEIPIEEAIEVALKVHPNTDTLAFITSTRDASSRQISEIAERSVFPKYRKLINLVVIKNGSVTEIRQRLARLPEDTLVFLGGQTLVVGLGRGLTPEENSREIAAVSPFPVYTFWNFHPNTGVLGGHLLTGLDQGHAAAELVLLILDGMNPDEIPIVMDSPSSTIFDYTVMGRFGITLRDLPPDSIVINRPTTIWLLYRQQIIGAITLIILETLLIVLLIRINRERRMALRELTEARDLLEQRVNERTVELQAANEKLERLSVTDGLTQLANRRHFDEVLEAHFLRLQRAGDPLSLIMLDIDFFKKFNDTYGHVEGDECLRQVACLLNRVVKRPTDMVARYGGEEFVVVLPETDARGAVALAEHIRSGICSLEIPHSSSCVADHVTASFGVATVTTTALNSPQEVITLADEQLYRAKSDGRNQVASIDLVEITEH